MFTASHAPMLHSIGEPRRGDIDIEICFGCRDLQTIAGDRDPTHVCCRPTAPLTSEITII